MLGLLLYGGSIVCTIAASPCGHLHSIFMFVCFGLSCVSYCNPWCDAVLVVSSFFQRSLNGLP